MIYVTWFGVNNKAWLLQKSNFLLKYSGKNMVMERAVLWVPGAFSWRNASLSTNSTFSTVRVVRFSPLPGFRSTVPVSSIFFDNIITDDRNQPLFENSFRNLFAPLFSLSQRRRK